MSADVIHIASTKFHSQLEMKVALYCAPLLTGIKISNILAVSNLDKEQVISMFQDTVISYYVLYESDTRVIFLLYNREDLCQYLYNQSIQNILKMFSYHKFELKDILREFSKRYARHMLYKDNFPHEMGLILGYPIEDVIGFIENKGQNSLYTGYWKVYANVTDKIELFNQYTHAKEMVIHMITQGANIHHILTNFVTNHAQRFSREANAMVT